MEQFQNYFNLTRGKDWKLNTNLESFNKNENEKIQSIKKQNIEKNIRPLIEEKMFKDACVHLGRVYNIIANKFARNQEEKIEYLSKAYEVCKASE